MSRRMPITPIARPSAARRAEAFRLVGMTSPLALRGFRTTFRMTPRSTTSRSAALGADEARQRLLEHLILAKPEELGIRIVGLQDLAFEVGDEHRVRGVGNDDVGIQRAVRLDALAVTLDQARLHTESKRSSHVGSPHGPPARRSSTSVTSRSRTPRHRVAIVGPIARKLRRIADYVLRAQAFPLGA